MDRAYAKQTAKLLANQFKLFKEAEEVIDVALGAEGDTRELKVAAVKLRGEIKDLQVEKTDALSSNKKITAGHKTRMAKLDEDFAEFKAQLETKMEEYTEKVAGEVKELKDSLAAEQAKHDIIIKKMEESRAELQREVDAVQAQAEALQKRASGLV